jgi:hypothetical protein
MGGVRASASYGSDTKRLDIEILTLKSLIYIANRCRNF